MTIPMQSGRAALQVFSVARRLRMASRLPEYTSLGVTVPGASRRRVAAPPGAVPGDEPLRLLAKPGGARAAPNGSPLCPIARMGTGLCAAAVVRAAREPPGRRCCAGPSRPSSSGIFSGVPRPAFRRGCPRNSASESPLRATAEWLRAEHLEPLVLAIRLSDSTLLSCQ